MQKKLYEWQKKCLKIWVENNGRGILNVVTGAGKTILALGAIEKIHEGLEQSDNLRVKIIVPKTFLVAQWSYALQAELSISREDIGCFSGNHKDSTNRKYMIYVVNSARYTIAKHILHDFNNGHPVMLIADECHHYGTAENSRIFEFLKSMPSGALYFSMGLSATPHCPNYEGVLKPALGKEIYRYSFERALKDGVINNFAIFNIKLNFEKTEEAEYTDVSDKLVMLFTN